LRAARARHHSNFKRVAITKFTQLCGAKIPPLLRSKLDQLTGNDEATAEFGIGMRHETV